MVGTAPSFSKAPFGDKSWEIFATGQATAGQLPRLDRFYEIHDPSAGHFKIPGYREFLAGLPDGTVQAFHRITPNCAMYPRGEVEADYGQFGRKFLSSTIAWMLAHLIYEGVGEGDLVGVFGADMLIEEEYGYQRAGCLHFLSLLEDRGVGIVLPPESGLLLSPPPYPNNDPHTNHIRRELAENERRLSIMAASADEMKLRRERLAGRVEAYKVILGTMQ